MSLRIAMAAGLLAAPLAAHAADLRDGNIVAEADLSTPAATLDLAKLDRATRDGDTPAPAPAKKRDGDGIPDQLDAQQRSDYRAVFAAIRSGRWADATIKLNAMKPGPLHAIARAELYTARNSPRVELAPLLQLLAEAPELPQADKVRRMAATRGATDLPALPSTTRLVWFDAAPVRQRVRTVRSDSASTEVALAIQPFIKADDGASAEALVERFSPDLTDDARTEWQQKVAWVYYVAGDDANARRVATKAQQGSGDWRVTAHWVGGLAAWRQKDCEGAGDAFVAVAQEANDVELRSAGLYWASRADMACGRPERVAAHLNGAAQYGETFYGLLARQALGIEDKPIRGETRISEDWRALERRPNVRVAAALVEIGENRLADEVLRHQAKLGTAQDHAALSRLAGRMNLPATQLWLSHNGPAGAKPLVEARYPAPDWTPDGGWRVDRNLVYAHTLQESRFNADVRSAAGAVGLLQVKPIAAIDVSRRRGTTYNSADLTRPSANMELGQSYIEQLRDSPFTGGLLPKVVAAYNAGPTPVTNWNSTIRDNGDPLLYIESIPYWETRGYVMIVLRNYWMYELQEGRKSTSRAALVDGMWPRFPGLPGATAVRVGGRASSY
ncbi:lytic transglycosylase domain-containing protein [Sphingomonas sp. AOB5]|uniref:lytic transglycosylase domain-containing protein n=1 Tax=Sphingomonas sp. AOB5 TaxID=3034017 RepID=UPI0023F7D166|nr:lytic transglycosylase domain-containing protein [Sphingomonas sp. AOB5]MDF7775770.1 lytic transglycosylase domain-containing protein [Sphingomonas sp. AOB5]